MNDLSDRWGSERAAMQKQRAQGIVRVAFARVGKRSEAQRAFETGGLRLRYPNAGRDCEAVIVNTGGGMAGGDRAEIDLAVESRARATVTTQAAEKVYRAEGAPTQSFVRIEVAAGAWLTWAPQETLLFEGAHFSRRLEAEVAPDGSLLIAESTVFGRLAHGETRIDASFRDDWRIRRGGKLIFAEALRLAEAGARLDQTAVGAGARAIATVLWVAPEAPSRLEDLRQALETVAAAPGERLEWGVSALDGFVLARALSPAPQRLRAALIAALRLLSGAEPPRVWS
jgi:urease accessory protein